MTTYYRGPTAGNWNAALWSLSPSAGPYTAGPPTSTDDAVFNTLSGSAALTTNVSCNSLVMIGGGSLHVAAHTLTITGKNSSNISLYVDNVASIPSALSGTIKLSDTSGSVNTVYSANILPLNLIINGVGGHWQLTSSLSTLSLTLNNGILDINNQNFIPNTFNIAIGTAATISNPGSLWSALQTLDISNATGLTATWPAVIQMVPSSAVFSGAGLSFNELEWSPVGSNTMTISGANSFSFLNINSSGAGNVLTLQHGVIQAVIELSLNGSFGNQLTVNSDSPGTAAIVQGPASTVFNASYVSLQDISLTESNGYFGNTSNVVSNVSGWAAGINPCATFIGGY
jgi:hypothetical protein